MKIFFSVLNKSGLFADMAEDELEPLLSCLGAQIKSVRRGEAALLSGDTPRHVGVVLEGRMLVTREDIDGNRSLIAELSSGELFAEALCCARVDESPVTVLADCDSTLMLLDFDRILHACPDSCPVHTRLVENMLGVIARKNLVLQRRMEIISLKSIRARVLLYLQPLALKRGGSVTIPFNREEFADFLCVERSALSHELARMKKDGLIDYKLRHFTLK